MSMILALTSVEDEIIKKVLADPPLIWKIVAPDGVKRNEDAAVRKQSWYSRFFGKQQPELVKKTEVDDIKPVEEIDLDKSWHGIHYLLTKTAWEGDPPLNFLLCGGSEVGDIDVGYGPSRAMRAADVLNVRDALESIDRSTLETQFDPSEMTRFDIYPTIWDRASDEDDTFGYCAEYFDELKAFVARTADKKLGIVISIQ